MLAAVLLVSSAGGSPELPRLPDLASTEPQVRAAIEEAHARLGGDPASAELWGSYASVLDAHSFGPEAVDAYGVAASLDPGEFRWPYLQAVLLVSLDPPASLPWFERALAINPSYAPLHVRYAAMMERMGRAGEATESYRRAVAADAQSADAHAGIGQRLLGDGKPQEAKVHLDRAVELDAQCRAALSGLAAWYRQAGDADLAAHFAHRAAAAPQRPVADEVVSAMRHMGVSTTAVLRRVDALRAAGRTADALRQLRRLIQANPESSRGRNTLGELLLEGGSYAAALEQFRGAIHLAPEFVPARLGLAQTLTRIGRLAEAQQEYEAVIVGHPTSVRAHAGLGACLARQGRWDAALQSMQRAFELGPNDRRARVGYGWALFNTGRYQPAIDVLAAEVAGDAGDEIAVEAFAVAGLAEARLGRDEEAAPLLRRAVDAAPERAELRRSLAAACLGLGRDAEARDVLEQGLVLDPRDGPIAVMLVELLSTSPDDEVRDGGRALRIGQALAESPAGHPEVPQALACAWAESGRYDEATRCARQALEIARQQAQAQLVQSLEARLAEFEQGRPWRRGGLIISP